MPPKPPKRTAAAAAVLLLLALSLATAGAAAFAPGTISFTAGAFEVDEAAGTATVTLSRNGGAEGAVSARVSLTDVTTNSADYRLAPGSVDTSFALVSPQRFFYYHQGLAVQPDGKVLVAGSPLLRLNADGTTDNGFHPPSFNAPVATVALQPDGKILVSGSFTGIPGAIRFARLNPDGSLDNTFNTGAGLNDFAIGIAVQPDGKVVIGGYFTTVNLSAKEHLARLNADGSLDGGFNTAVGTNCYTVALQPDGKILATGPYPGLVRFNPDGSYDNGFQSNFAGGYAVPLPDGKVIAGGGTRNQNGVVTAVGVFRLNPDGSRDASFHTGLGSDNGVSGLAVQPDGKIVVAGYFASYDGAATGPLIRLNADGTRDTTFNANGFQATNPYIETMAMQPDGKVIVGGNFTVNVPGGYRSNVARFNSDLFVSWADGDVADKTINIPVVDDLLDEPDETATLNVTALTQGSSAGAFPAATLTIRDNDAAPSFTSGAPPQAVTRAAYTHTFAATGAPAPTFGVTGGTLPPGLFLSSAGVLSGTPTTAGTYSNIAVTASNGVSPAATQTFDLVVLSGGALQFSAGSYTVSENAGTATVTVNRVGGSAGATSVNFVITGNTASSGGDFSPASATLNFADGETSKDVTVTIVNDDINERDEFANLFLNTVNGTGALGTPTVATLNITNDDPLPSIAIDDVNVTEGDSGTKLATFTVTRTGLTDRAVTFTARTVDGTANSVEDYVPVVNTVFQLGPNVSSTAVSVSVFGDTIVEPDKSFSVLLTSPSNATISRAQGTAVVRDNDTTTGPPTVQLGAREFKASEGAGLVAVTVTRSGDSSSPTSVTYTTTSPSAAGSASERRDYTLSLGTLRFAAGETSKTVNIFVADDTLVEGDETLQVVLGTPTGGAALGTPSSSTVRILDDDAAASQTNPVDDTTFFVRQHYRDFLNRDPDASGLAFWTNEIEQCGADAQCREVKRVNVSAAFFLSIEFQETGYLVYLLHKAAFNSGERLALRTFLADTQAIGEGVVVGTENWPARLEANRATFLEGFVQRTPFLSLYPTTMTAAQYVDALNANTGDPLNPAAGGALTPAERDALVADLASGARSRAQVLRAVAENREYKRRQFNKAFVLMQYVGYLRRGPNETPDTTFDGYNFWLGKLNDFQGNYINAEMVKAFLSAAEYRQRFGQQ